MTDELVEARTAYFRYLENEIGCDAAREREDDIDLGREDDSEFIAGYSAALAVFLAEYPEIGRVKLRPVGDEIK